MSLDDALSAKLLAAARKARESSYAPYSNINVGAALLLESGEIVSGANVENASYGLTTCAERIAIFSAVTNHRAKRFRAIAVSVFGAPSDTSLGPREVSPCGACRQVMAEFMDDDASVIVDGSKTYALGELLPDAFRIK
ncbi:cytidine deaminase [alpha proteobacterium U9-1i]|nr:cytidine deaminase [alpha proteobacterium U9-1i]